MNLQLDAQHPLGDASIRRFIATNGLRVVVLEDHGAPIVSYQTWYGVGSRHESPGRTGMAHLFEHLMFNQTESVGPGEFDRLIERTGGDTNAATSVDWTYYRDTVPARDLELVMRLEADRMQNLTLAAPQLEAEREVVINERLMRVEDDVDGFLDEQLFRSAFTTHPYHWPTLGWSDDLRATTVEDLLGFYRDHYAPNNATLVIVGDVDTDVVQKLVSQYYGPIESSSLKQSPEPGPEPAQTAERRQELERPVVADRAVIGYKVPGQSHVDWPALELLAGLLCSSGPSARLQRLLVSDLQLASTVYGSVTPFRDPGLFEIGFTMTRQHRADEALHHLDRVIGDILANGVDLPELQKVHNCVETDFWCGMSTLDGKAEALGHFEIVAGDFRELFTLAKRQAAVTASDLVRVAGTYLRRDQRTIVIAKPGELA